jgi:hypothetical protein
VNLDSGQGARAREVVPADAHALARPAAGGQLAQAGSGEARGEDHGTRAQGRRATTQQKAPAGLRTRLQASREPGDPRGRLQGCTQGSIQGVALDREAGAGQGQVETRAPATDERDLLEGESSLEEFLQPEGAQHLNAACHQALAAGLGRRADAARLRHEHTVPGTGQEERRSRSRGAGP